MRVPSVPRTAAECLGTITHAYPKTPLSDARVLAALRKPVWPDGETRAVWEIANGKKNICIVVSDSTRQTAANRVLPIMIKALCERGCSADRIRIVVATGIHRPPTPTEIEKILGPSVAARFVSRITSHDPDNESNLVCVGSTSRGYRVKLNRLAVESDCLMTLGAVTYHYHAGFGGGRKSIAPGLASRDTIAHNHSLALDFERNEFREGVEIGRLDGNPVSDEMLQAAMLCQPHIIVNTVVSPDGRLAGIVSGHLDAAHRAACRALQQFARVDLREPADFVIAACGARDWIQAHKALVNAARAVKPDGFVVLAAPCPEGLGNERFREWVKIRDITELFKRLKHLPEVNGQTAVSTRRHAPRTVLVSQMSRTDIQDLGMETSPDIESAVQLVLRKLAEAGRNRPRYYVMPDATHVTPFIVQS